LRVLLFMSKGDWIINMVKINLRLPARLSLLWQKKSHFFCHGRREEEGRGRS
jgi:hypothetical protein